MTDSLVTPDEVLKASLHEYAKQGLKLSERLERLEKEHGLHVGLLELIQFNKKFHVPPPKTQRVKTIPGPSEVSEDEVWLLIQAKLEEEAGKSGPSAGVEIPSRTPLSVAEVHKMLVLDGYSIPRASIRKAMTQEKTTANHNASIPSSTCAASNRETDSNALNVEPANPTPSSTSSIQPTSRSLSHLLDLTGLNTQPSITARFDEIAQSLILRHHLNLTNGQTSEDYSILEVEFYLLKPGLHVDPFTHGAEEQRRAGRWYFHRAPKPGGGVSMTGWRDGTRKGLDLTFGGPVDASAAAVSSSADPVKETRGGILLRTLMRRSDSQVICGPSLLADEVISKSGAASIRDLVQEVWAGDTYAFGNTGNDSVNSINRQVTLSVRKNDTSAPRAKVPTLYSSPRIGLDLSNPTVTPTSDHPRVVYVSKSYRYFTQPALFGDKGRVHSFVGVYSHLLAGHARPPTGPEWDTASLSSCIASILSMRPELALKYVGHFHANEPGDLEALKQYVGKAGKGASGSPAAFLGMMGVLVEGQRVGAGNTKQPTLFFGRKTK